MWAYRFGRGAYHFPGFCGNQHIRDHSMHASSFHCAFMSFHVPFMFLSLVFMSIHFPFMFIPMCIHVLSYSFHLHAFSFHFAFMSFHFLSKVVERPYGLAREPSATKRQRERERQRETERETQRERESKRERGRDRASWMPNSMVTAGNRAPQVEFPSSVLPVLWMCTAVVAWFTPSLMNCRVWSQVIAFVGGLSLYSVSCTSLTKNSCNTTVVFNHFDRGSYLHYINCVHYIYIYMYIFEYTKT